MKWLFLGIFFVLFFLFLLEYRIVGQAVYGDGRYYWAFTRSIYFDQNIDISDEMAHLYSPESNNKPAKFGHVAEFAHKSKEISRGFSLGISLIWLPLYIVGDGATVVLQSIGIPVVRNGYSDPYQLTVGVGSILFVVSGLIVLSRALRRYFPQKVLIPTLLLVLFTTNLLYYSGLDVLNSHPFAFLLVSILIWSYTRFLEKKETKYLMVQALIVGLLMGNRTQDALFLIIPLLAPLIVFLNKFVNLFKNWLFFSKKYFIIFLFIFLGYLPQFLLLVISQKEFLLVPHLSDKTFTLPIYLIGIFFSTKLGIFFYMPMLLVGIGGLLLLRKKLSSSRNLFLVVILLHFILISSWHGWPQAAYSMRYFISLLPLIAFGIAEVVDRLQKRYSLGLVYALVAIFILHQLVMIFNFKLFLQDSTNVGPELSRSGKLKIQIIQQLDKATQNLPFR